MADDEDGAAWLHSSSPFMTVPVQMFVCCTVDPPVLATHPSGDGVRYMHFWCCLDRLVTRQQLETRVLEVMQGAGASFPRVCRDLPPNRAAQPSDCHRATS